MAAPDTDDDKGPIGSSYGSPGLGGAIKDVIKAVALATAPRSIVQRKQKIDKEVDDAVLGRMKAAQSTDKDNSYAY